MLEDEGHHRHLPRVYIVVTTEWRSKHHHRHHRKHRKVSRYRLFPNQETMFMTTVTVGHQVTYTIQYLDANGNPMLVTPTPDAPPVWTGGANPAIDTMSVSADGSTDVVQAIGPGADTIGVSLSVGGVAFAASDNLTVQAPPQVLTSIALVATVA